MWAASQHSDLVKVCALYDGVSLPQSLRSSGCSELLLGCMVQLCQYVTDVATHIESSL